MYQIHLELVQVGSTKRLRIIWGRFSRGQQWWRVPSQATGDQRRACDRANRSKTSLDSRGALPRYRECMCGAIFRR